MTDTAQPATNPIRIDDQDWHTDPLKAQAFRRARYEASKAAWKERVAARPSDTEPTADQQA